jgi:hypothetical protein
VSEEPAEEWVSEWDVAKVHAEAMRRARQAIAHVQDMNASAGRVLIELYLIRDRLASLERETSELAARFRTN